MRFLCISCSVDRLIYMDDMVKAWKGPFSISIFLVYKDINTLSTWIQSQNITNLRLSIYLAVPPNKSNNYINIPQKNNKTYKRMNKLIIYPINYLRDLAIMNIRTTHFLNMDMDLWPSCTIHIVFLISHYLF